MFMMATENDCLCYLVSAVLSTVWMWICLFNARSIVKHSGRLRLKSHLHTFGNHSRENYGEERVSVMETHHLTVVRSSVRAIVCISKIWWTHIDRNCSMVETNSSHCERNWTDTKWINSIAWFDRCFEERKKKTKNMNEMDSRVCALASAAKKRLRLRMRAMTAVSTADFSLRIQPWTFCLRPKWNSIQIFTLVSKLNHLRFLLNFSTIFRF